MGRLSGIMFCLFLFAALILDLAATAGSSQTTQHAHLVARVGHSGNVVAVAFFPDGRYVLTGGEDKTARIWDAASGQELRKFEGHTEKISSVSFSHDGRSVLTGSWDETARLWDRETGKEIERFEPKSGYVKSAGFSPDGRYIWTLGYIVKLWDSQTGKLCGQLGNTSLFTNAVAFSPDNRFVLTGDSDNTARLWDLALGGKESLELDGHSGSITSVAFSPDGGVALTGSEDNTARMWDLTSGKELKRIIGPVDSLAANKIQSVAFSPDGKMIMTADGDSTIWLWDSHEGKMLQRLKDDDPDYILSGAFSPDGSTILTGGSAGSARLWDTASGKPLRRFVGDCAPVDSVAFSSDGRYILTQVWGDPRAPWKNWTPNAIRLWDTASGKELWRLNGVPNSVRSIAVSPDGRYLLAGGVDKIVRMFDLASGAELRRFQGHSSTISALAFSEDGRYILSGSYDNTAIIWDTTNSKELRCLKGHSSYITSVSFSPHGRMVLTGSADNTARIWDAKTGIEKVRVNGDPEGVAIDAVAFSPDGSAVLTSGIGNVVRMSDAVTGKELRQFEGRSEAVQSLAFSPDGRFVATGSMGNLAKIWDATSGQELHRLEGHSGWVKSVAFSADGRHLLTGSTDGTTRLWNIEAGEELVALVSFYDGGWATVDPSGRYDSSDSENSSSLYWVSDSLRTIDLGQLKREFYTPGLLARVMRGDRLPDVTGMDTVALPPIASVSGKFNSSTLKEEVSLKNDGGGVGKVFIKVNSRLLRVIEKIDAPGEEGSVAVPIDLTDAPFVEGDNTIQITAYDASNRIESHEAVTHYTMPASAKGFGGQEAGTTALGAGNFYALVVGTSQFGDPKLNLRFPAKDAESVAAGLRLGAERLYGEAHVWIRVLTSEANSEAGLPTKKNIRAAFDEIRQQARPEDTLVVYLSGHGVMSGSNRDLYYYLTADARTLDVESDPTLRDVSAVSSDELFEWLREPVKTMPLKQVVILDTCAAGGVSDALSKLSEKRDVPPDQLRAIELLKDAAGTFILMGSAADSVSYEASKYGEGLLTYALLQGMRGASLDDGSRLGVVRWFQDASEQVPDLAKSIGGVQKPMIAAPKGRGFPVGLLTTEDRAKIPLALPIPQLLRVLCEDENQEDPLHLRPLLRARLRALNYTQALGDKSIQYIDAIDDDLPGALSPRLRYAVKADRVEVRIRLISDSKTIAEQSITGIITDLNGLASMLSNEIVTMAVLHKVSDTGPGSVVFPLGSRTDSLEH